MIPAGASTRPPSSPGVTVVNASTQSDLSLLTGTESSIGNLIASLERKTNHSLLNNVKNMVNFQMFTSNLSTGYYSSCWYSAARRLGIWGSCWLIILWFRVMIGNSPLLSSDKLITSYKLLQASLWIVVCLKLQHLQFTYVICWSKWVRSGSLILNLIINFNLRRELQRIT